MSLVIMFHFTVSMLNMFRTLIHPSSGACDCAVELTHRSFYSWFIVCWIFGVAGFEQCPCCRLLEIWCGWVLVVSVLRGVGDLVRLGLSGVCVAGCWRFGVVGFEWCLCCRLLEIWCGWI